MWKLLNVEGATRLSWERNQKKWGEFLLGSSGSNPPIWSDVCNPVVALASARQKRVTLESRVLNRSYRLDHHLARCDKDMVLDLSLGSLASF